MLGAERQLFLRVAFSHGNSCLCARQVVSIVQHGSEVKATIISGKQVSQNCLRRKTDRENPVHPSRPHLVFAYNT